jgi:hypothetical protein
LNLKLSDLQLITHNPAGQCAIVSGKSTVQFRAAEAAYERGAFPSTYRDIYI